MENKTRETFGSRLGFILVSAGCAIGIGNVWKSLTGTFEDTGPDEAATVFSDMLANPSELLIFMAVTVVAGFLVLSFGVKNGLERVNKFMMIGLLALILILAVMSLTLEKASEGMKFYLLPDIDSIKSVGLFNIITAAMNQAFFTLNLGITAIEVYR